MKKNDCSCSKDKKIPKIEKKFLSEQRNKRSMIIGNVDQTNTARNVKKYFRNMPSSGTLTMYRVMQWTHTAFLPNQLMYQMITMNLSH